MFVTINFFFSKKKSCPFFGHFGQEWKQCFQNGNIWKHLETFQFFLEKIFKKTNHINKKKKVVHFGHFLDNFLDKKKEQFIKKY